MKKFLLLLFVLFIAGGSALFYEIQNLLHKPIHTEPHQVLVLERGTTGKKLADLLEKEKLLENAQLLPYLLRLQPQLNKIKAGTYGLDGINTVGDLLELLNSGKELQLSLRFTEGETIKQVLNSLKKADYLQQTLEGKSAREQEIFVFNQFKELFPENEILHKTQKLDGWISPNTYNYAANSTDLALLKRALQSTVEILDKAWNERDENLPLANKYEMLILASIVEKETSLAKERPLVASVFINRLNINMKLQTDPTVIYGLGDKYDGTIYKKDLTTPTDYNTYVIDGLPPTPIANPSEASILAVAHPANSKFLYFVADGTGGHKFTENYNDHNKAVQEYRRWQREKGLR